MVGAKAEEAKAEEARVAGVTKKPAHGAQKALRNYGKPKIPVFLMGGEDCSFSGVSETFTVLRESRQKRQLLPFYAHSLSVTFTV